ncbi:MAG TPA: AraC family transcriptional regulator [Kiloniellales bacterium]|nr:AraC family transcriptional regulator [Kiloniellales bacterium]
MQPSADIETWGATMPRPPVATSEGRGWRLLTARRFRHTPVETFTAPPLAQHLVTLFLRGSAELDWQLEDRRLSGRTVPGHIMVMAAGQVNVWRWTGWPDVLHLYLPPGYLSDLAAEAGTGPVELIDTFDRDDPVMFSLGRHVLREIEQGCTAVDSLAGEALAQLVGVQLLRKHSVRPLPPQSGAALPAWRLRRVTELVESRLDGELTIAAMAEAAGLSAYHFSRSFKATTGRPPHRYLLERRIERAKELLRDGKQEIVQVALAAGFASQEHMTTVFRRLTGTTPARYRRARRS